MSPNSRRRTAESAEHSGVHGAPALASRDVIACLRCPACPASDWSLLAPVGWIAIGLRAVPHSQRFRRHQRPAPARRARGCRHHPTRSLGGEPQATVRGVGVRQRVASAGGRAWLDQVRSSRRSRAAHRTGFSGVSASWRSGRRPAWLERRGRCSGSPSHARSSAVRRRFASASCEATYGILPSCRILARHPEGDTARAPGGFICRRPPIRQSTTGDQCAKRPSDGCGRPPPTYRWIDEVLRNRADDYRLPGSPLLGLPGVQRLARQSFRRSAFADLHAAWALLQKGTERASAILTTRQALALQLFRDGQPMSDTAARLGLRSHQHL